MALSVALPLSGLETETFSSYRSFGLRDILGISHTSPTPSVSSDSCSIGSLGSLKSESINSESVPSSPQAAEKKIVSSTPEPERNVMVMYGGRDILDLGKNLQMKEWSMRAAYLPPNNTSVFFANRSQYHRLGDFPVDHHPMGQCRECGFTYIAEVTLATQSSGLTNPSVDYRN